MMLHLLYIYVYKYIVSLFYEYINLTQIIIKFIIRVILM